MTARRPAHRGLDLARWVLAVCPALALIASDGASAQEADEPLVTDRPDFTESPVSVQPGRVQLEGGYTHEEAGDVTTDGAPELLLRIGLTDALELRLAANSYTRVAAPGGDASGLEDPFVGIKLEAARGSETPSFLEPAMALLVGSSLPVGSTDIGEDDAVPEVLLALDWTLPEPLGIASNIGLSYESEDGEQFLQGSFSTALGVGLGASWGLFFEYYAFVPEGSERDVQHFLDTGATRLLSNDFQLDVRVGTEVGGETDYFAGVGLAYRW
jgi:hypothetical protein